MKILQEKLVKLEVDRVLDIATGSGQFIKILKDGLRDFHQIIGVDTSKKALKIAEQNFQNDKIRFQWMRAEDLEFEDCSFDIVSLSNSIHHLENYSKVFSEIKRVLKPDGMVIFNEMFCDNQSQSQLSHVYLHHFMAEIDRCVARFHNPTYKKQEIIDIVKDQGFHIMEVFEYEEIDTGTKEEMEEEIKSLKDLCDSRLTDIKSDEKYDELAAKAKIIEDYLDQHGLSGATQLILFAH